jgi:hypothetical protein
VHFWQYQTIAVLVLYEKGLVAARVSEVLAADSGIGALRQREYQNAIKAR